MVMYVLWLLMCFFIGHLVGEFGKYLVASMALAASDAVIVGVMIGFVAGCILMAVNRYMAEFD